MELKDKNLYYVGGVVRDEILNIPSFDIDLCYEGNAIDFAKGLNIIKTNPDFGTVRVQFEEREIDIASTRTETYPQLGHLPCVNEIGCSLIEDLKRRDFTINAMAKNTLSGELIDYFNGLNDIKSKKIKILHNKSFIEDPTRIIRALKFSVRFGFELEENTKKLQDQYLENINYDMSYHRLKKELKETFNLNNPKAYDKFIEDKIYKLLGKNQTIPKINISPQNLIKKYSPDNPWLVYLGLFNLSNFDLNSEEQNIISSFNYIKNTIPKTDLEIYNLFKNIPLESIILYAISVSNNIAETYLEKLSNINIEIKGDDLIQLNIPQGKLYKEIFNFVTEEKIKNPSLNKFEEIELVKKYIQT